MRITQVRLSGTAGESQTYFPIVGLSPAESFIIKSITGLGPPKKDVVIANKQYQGSAWQDRQVVIMVGLNPVYADGESSESLRETLMEKFTAGLEYPVMSFRLYDETTAITANRCVMTGCEPIHFAKDPTVQITLDFLDPMLRAVGEENVAAGTGTKDDYTITAFGTAPMGFRQRIVFTADQTGFLLAKEATWGMTLLYEFESGDDLTIDTLEGSRRIFVIRSAVTTNIISTLTEDSTWLELTPGENSFTTSGITDYNWTYAAIYRPLYLGV